MYFYEMLTSKWGKFLEFDEWYEQVDTKFISDKSKLNLLFKKISIDKIKNIFFETYGLQMDEQLLNFYKKFNGCKLFSNSLCIYGFKSKDSLYTPFDLNFENNRQLKDENIIYFGSLGGKYLFGFKKDIPKTIYVYEVKTLNVVKTYQDFNTCFNTIFNNLINEYDLEGRKININKKYLNIPVLLNLSCEEKYL